MGWFGLWPLQGLGISRTKSGTYQGILLICRMYLCTPPLRTHNLRFGHVAKTRVVKPCVDNAATCGVSFENHGSFFHTGLLQKLRDDFQTPGSPSFLGGSREESGNIIPKYSLYTIFLIPYSPPVRLGT